MSEYSYYYAEQQAPTPRKADFENPSRLSYTPLGSTEPGGTYMHPSTSNLTRRAHYFGQRAQSASRIMPNRFPSRDEPAARPISNFDQPTHRSTKRRVDSRYTRDSNIFNIQSLAQIRRGSSQPSQQRSPHMAQTPKQPRAHGKPSHKTHTGRSVSVFNFQDIHSVGQAQQQYIQPSRRQYKDAPHIKSTIFNHEHEQEPRNTGRFLTSYQLAARSLSPLTETGKNPRVIAQMEEREQQSSFIRHNPSRTKRNNQNWKNWSTLGLSDEDGVSQLYKQMHSRLNTHHSALVAPTTPKTSNQAPGQKKLRNSSSNFKFRPVTEAQASAYEKFMSKSAMRSKENSPAVSMSNISMADRQLPQVPQTSQQRPLEVKETRYYQPPSLSEPSPARTQRTRSEMILPTPPRVREMQREADNHFHLHLERSPPPGQAQSEYLPRHDDSIIDDGTYSELAVSEIGRRPKPDWLVDKEARAEELSLQAGVSASVKLNPQPQNSADQKFYQQLLVEEQQLKKKLDKIRFSHQRVKRGNRIEKYEVPSEAESYVKRLDLEDNNFVDKMSGDPQYQKYKEKQREREKLRNLAQRNMVAGQSDEMRKKAKLSGLPSALSPNRGDHSYFRDGRASLPCTSLDVGEVTPEMVVSRKQNHHARLLAQIQQERTAKMNEKIQKLENDKYEKQEIKRRNNAYYEQVKEMNAQKRQEIKDYINRQRREKVQLEIDRVMAKTKLGIAAKQQARQMEQSEKQTQQQRKALTMKVADIQRAQMMLKSQHRDVQKSVERLVASPARNF